MSHCRVNPIFATSHRFSYKGACHQHKTLIMQLGPETPHWCKLGKAKGPKQTLENTSRKW